MTLIRSSAFLCLSSPPTRQWMGGDKIAFHESQMDWNMKLAIDLVPVPVGCLGMCFYSFSARLDFAINSNQYIIHSPAYNTAFVWNPLTRMTIPLLQFKITIECFIISAVIYALGSFWPLPIWCVFCWAGGGWVGHRVQRRRHPATRLTALSEVV